MKWHVPPFRGNDILPLREGRSISVEIQQEVDRYFDDTGFGGNMSRRRGEIPDWLSMYEHAHYVPVGAVTEPDYSLHRLDSAFLPSYIAEILDPYRVFPNATTAQRSVSAEIELVEGASYRFDSTVLPLLLKSIGNTNFTIRPIKSFSAPAPTAQYPSPPKKPIIQFEGFPSEPAFTRPPEQRGSFLQTLIPGLANYYRRKAQATAAADHRRRYAAWEKECARIDENNSKILSSFSQSAEGIAYAGAVEEYEVENKSIKTKFSEAKSRWEAERTAYDESADLERAKLQGVANGLRTGDLSAFATFVTLALNAVTYPFPLPREYLVKCDFEKRIIDVEISFPSFAATDFFRYVTSAPQVCAAKEKKSLYDLMLFSVIVRTIYDVCCQNVIESKFALYCTKCAHTIQGPSNRIGQRLS